MNKIYFDCTGGVSGDMVFSAMLGLLDTEEEKNFVEQELKKLNFGCGHGHEHSHTHGDTDGHTHCEHRHERTHQHTHRSYREIKDLILQSEVSENAKEIALAIYAVIAKAEASVHETTIEEVHFHEVGRDEAVRNIVGIAICADKLAVSEAYCSAIHDGRGFIECSHGTIPVPAPAVMAMREDCAYVFVTDEVETEMVTPSGLAVLIGLGAVCSESLPQGKALREAVVFGKRQTGKTEGFKAMLFK